VFPNNLKSANIYINFTPLNCESVTQALYENEKGETR